MIARKSLIIFANSILGALLGFVALKVIALYFGREPFGAFYYALGLLGLMFALTDFAFQAAHTKRVSEGHDAADYLASYLWMKLAFSIFYMGTFGITLYVLVTRFPEKLTSTTVPILILAALYYLLRGLMFVPQATFDARRETARTQLGALADNVVRTVATVAAAFVLTALVFGSGPFARWIRPGENPFLDSLAANPGETLAATFVLGALAQNAVLYWQMRRIPVGRFRWDIVKGYWKFSYPLILTSFILVISTSIDRITVGYFWNAGEVGDLSGAQRIVTIVDAIPVAVATLLFPTISGMHARNELSGAADLVARSMRYLSLVVLPVVIVTVALAPDIIHIVLADTFEGSAAILSVLVLYIFVMSLQWPFLSLVQGMDRPGLAAKVGAVMAGSNIVLNLILVPADVKSLGITLFGLKGYGAAIGTLVSAFIGLTFYYIAAKRLSPIRLPWGSFARQAVAAVGAMGALTFIEAVRPVVRWWDLAAYSVTGGLVYLLILLVLREFTREDFRFFWNTVHPGKTLEYFRTEIFGRR